VIAAAWFVWHRIRGIRIEEAGRAAVALEEEPEN
jgi:hypothetical protein